MKPDPGRYGFEPAVISAARRNPVNVRAALKQSQRLTGAALARELVRIVLDADRRTIAALLEQVGRIENETLRARTLFSVLAQARSALVRTLPRTAQDVIVCLTRGLKDEKARALALTQMRVEIPTDLKARLVSLAEA